VDECGILPGTWKATIVEENITLLELTKNALLLILLDEVTNLIGSNLILFPAQIGKERGDGEN
jgi:hypothetical protein